MSEIPKEINYTFGIDENFCNRPFLFSNFLNILSAKANNPNYQINIFYKYLPEKDPYIKELSSFCNFKYRDFDYDINFSYAEHKGCFFRINQLYNNGGIYLDSDVVCVKSFDDLLSSDCTMGLEIQNDGTIWGLCNAVILAKKKSYFLEQWIKNYKLAYKEKNWNFNAVQQPWLLSKNYSKYINIVPSHYFFKFIWGHTGYYGREIFELNSDISNIYCIHLWASLFYENLKKYDLNYIKQNSDTLSNIYKKYI